MGPGPGPRSRSSFSRVLGMEQESDARMGTDVDVTPRSGRVSVSYDRVMNISMDMATAAASQYQSDGVVCPLILRNGIFTTAAVDNIDHNPSSNTAQDAFHCTGISLFQNREEEFDGVQRERAILPCLQPGISNKKIPQLPES